MTEVEYNGVNLDMIKTLAVEQEPVYSNDGVDYLYTRFRVSVRSVINPILDAAMEAETSPIDMMNRMRGCLLRPHKTFTMTVNNVVYLTSDATIDDNNGPRPIHCNIVSVSDTTFIVDYVIEFYLNECCSTTAGQHGLPSPPRYVSHRFVESMTIDEEGYTRRHVTGRVVLLGSAHEHPANLRDLVFLAKPKGFVRKSAEYTVQSDGLALDYSYTDMEVYKTPPFPATKWSADHTISTVKGAVFTASVTVRMVGNNTTSKLMMIRRAAIIALGRLFPNVNVAAPFDLQDDQGVNLGGSLRESLDSNSIELTVSALNQMTIGQTIYGFLPNDNRLNADIEKVRGVDANPLPDSPGFHKGDTLNPAIMWLKKSVEDLCAATKSDQSAATASASGTEAEQTSTVVTVTETLPVFSSSTKNDINGKSGAYTDYEMDIDYQTDMCRVQMPVAGNTTSCAIAILAQPVVRKIVNWTAERVKNQPVVPSQLSKDENLLLLSSTISPATPTPLPDGKTLIWRISGQYVYAVRDSANVTLTAGTVPYMTTQPADTVYGTQQFTTELTDGGSSPLTQIVTSG